MKKTLMIFYHLMVIIVIGGLASVSLASSDHHKKTIEVPIGFPAISVSLRVTADKMDGVNLTIKADNYRMTPPNQTSKNQLSSQNKTLQGHAHLYINGAKIQRVYGPNIHIPHRLLTKGNNIIKVTLNSHHHAQWTSNGKVISAEVQINS